MPFLNGLRKYRLSKALLAKGVFLFIILVSFFGILNPYQAQAGFLSDFWKKISGGQTSKIEPDSSVAAISMPLLNSQNNVSLGVGGPEGEYKPALSSTQDSALVGVRNPAGTLPMNGSDQILIYTVVAGDNPSTIANRFGISLNTLLWANDLRNPNSIKVGDNLIILPVSGLQYRIKKGDTLKSIAKKFKPKDIGNDLPIFVNDILSYNNLAVDEPLVAGNEILIPDGEITTPVSSSPNLSSKFSSLPSFMGYYARPIAGGRKTQGLHGYNGVDLASSCGFPVYASASGNVIISKSSGWNGGYGKYAVVNHANNTQTLYAHLSHVYVSVGQYLNQGDMLGIIGSSGNSTGCHVHFEIRGAVNPF